MKLKPHKGVYKIRIYKKHGKRVPMSRWILQLANFRYTNREAMWIIGSMENPKVTDLTRVPKLTLTDIFTPQPIVDIDAILNFDPRSTIFNEIGKPKPSLWQRIKRKVKR